MESIHFEKQEASLCAQHAVNMLLQGSYFTAVDLAEIASEVDRREGRVLTERGAKSHNVDDSGYFSLQVIAEALKVFNLELVPLNSPRAVSYRDDPTLGQAYICNLNEHWFAVRRLGFQWFTLNSLLPTPRLISDTYLSLFFAQLINDGYSIFVVEGVLPPCIADEQLAQCPVDPSLAGKSDSYRDDQSEDPNLARAKAMSSAQAEEDEELRLALELSKQEMKSNAAALKATEKSSSISVVSTQSQRSSGEEDDEELERQLQKAIQLSMESSAQQQQQQQQQDIPGSSSSVAATSGTEAGGLGITEVKDSSGDEISARTAASEENSSEMASTEEIRKKRENFLKRFEK